VCAALAMITMSLLLILFTIKMYFCASP
jgi:hypothetical protein